MGVTVKRIPQSPKFKMERQLVSQMVPVAVPQPDLLQLTVPRHVAETLHIILRNVGGNPDGRRSDVDQVVKALQEAGVRTGYAHPDIDRSAWSGAIILTGKRSKPTATTDPEMDAWVIAQERRDLQRAEQAARLSILKDMAAKEDTLLRAPVKINVPNVGSGGLPGGLSPTGSEPYRGLDNQKAQQVGASQPIGGREPWFEHRGGGQLEDCQPEKRRG